MKKILLTLWLGLSCTAIFAQAPANDNCSNAINLTANTACVNGTTVGATLQAGEPTAQGCWGTATDATVWYKFTTGAVGGYVVSTDNGSADTQLKLYSGSCGALTMIDCSDDDGSTNTFAGVVGACNLPANTTYYVQVDIYGTSRSAFCIQLLYYPPLDNDCPNNATDITALINNVNTDGTVPFSCAEFAYSNAACQPTHDILPGDNSTAGANACHLGATNGSDIYDVWFKFTVDANTPQVWLDGFLATSTNAGSYASALYSGTPSGPCGGNITGLTYIDCSAGTFVDDLDGGLGGPRDVSKCSTPIVPRIDASNLPDGTYYLRIWDYTGATPDGSINLCAESSTPIGITSDRCPDEAKLGDSCGTMPNWNVNKTYKNLSNAGCLGNACTIPTPDEPVLATSPAGDARENCSGTWTTFLGNVNNVINNTALYAFDVNACASCQATVSLKIDNLTFSGTYGKAIQAMVMQSACTGPNAVAIMNYAGTVSCVELRPSSLTLPNGRYFVMIDGQDGQLIKFDLTLTITYGGGIGPNACTASTKPVAAITQDKTAVCPLENVTLNSTGSTFGMTGTTQSLCGAVTYAWDIDGGTLVSGSLTGAGPLVVNWPNTGCTPLTKTIKLIVSNNGCPSAEVTKTVTVKPTPTSTFDITPLPNPTKVCVNTDATFTYTGCADATAVYTWNFNGGTSNPGGTLRGPQLVRWATSGTKNISLSVNWNGCTSSIATGQVQVLDAPTVTFSNSRSTICSDGTTSIQYTGNASANNITWNFGAAGDFNILSGDGFTTPYVISWNTPGAKNITVTASTGAPANCSAISPITTVTVLPPIQFDPPVTTLPSACAASDGSITVNAQPAGTYTYNWTAPAVTGATLNGIPAGSYTVTATNSIGCQAQTTVTLDDPAAHTISQLTTIDANCFGDMNGSATITVTGAAATYNYQLSGTSSFTANGQGPVLSFSGLAAGNYSVKVTDGSCSKSRSFTIKQPSSPVLASLPSVPEICPGASTVLTAGASGGNPTTTYGYTWKSGASTIASNVSSITVSPSGPTTYSVTVTDAKGCEDTKSITVGIRTLPTSTFTIAHSPICVGEEDTITYTGSGTASDNFTWNRDNPTTLRNGSSFRDTYVSWNSAGTKTITLVVDDGCPSALTTITVEVLDPPVATFSSSTNDVCAGSPVIFKYNGTQTGLTEIWDFDNETNKTQLPNGSWVVSWSNPGNTTLVRNPKLTVKAGNCESTIQNPINILPIPVAPTAVTPPPYCKNETAVPLTASTVNCNTCNILWYGTNQGGTGTLTPTVPQTTTPGTTAYYLTQILGTCEGPAATVNVDVTDLDDPEFGYLDNYVCQNQPSFAIDYALVPGGTFKDLTGGLIFLDNAGTVDVMNSPAKKYTIRYITPNTCKDSSELDLTIRSLPLTGMGGVNSEYCTIENTATIVATAGASLATTLKVIPTTPGTNLSLNRYTINPKLSDQGIYTIQNKVTRNNCTDSSFITIKIINTPDSAFTTGSFCQGVAAGGSILAVAPQNPAYTYAWTFQQGSPASSNNYAPPVSLKWLQSGKFTTGLRVSNSYLGSKLCSFGTNNKVITVAETPISTFESDPTLNSDLNAPRKFSLMEADTIPFQFQATKSDYSPTSYQWFIDGALYEKDTFLPTAYLFKDSGLHIIQLTVTTGPGCTSEFTKAIYISDDFRLLAPNAFSPNNDGVNDRFIPTVFGMTITDFKVFDRWGAVAFNGTDVNGWDGTVDGKAAPDGVYVFIVTGKSRTNQKVTQKGIISLNR